MGAGCTAHVCSRNGTCPCPQALTWGWEQPLDRRTGFEGSHGPFSNLHVFMYVRFSEKMGLRILSYSPEGLGPNVVKLPGGWQG